MHIFVLCVVTVSILQAPGQGGSINILMKESTVPLETKSSAYPEFNSEENSKNTSLVSTISINTSSVNPQDAQNHTANENISRSDNLQNTNSGQSNELTNATPQNVEDVNNSTGTSVQNTYPVQSNESTSVPDIQWDKNNTTQNRSTELKNTNGKTEEETSTGIYYFQIILITLSSFAVVVMAAYLTKQLAGRSVTRRRKLRGHRGGFGKRYSDISLQMININSIEIPNISSLPESPAVTTEIEEPDAFIQENGELHPMQNAGDGSPESDGEWL